MSVRKIVVLFILMVALPFVSAHADEIPHEINYLLTQMGNSDCTFIRNGKAYDAGAAEAHIRMKYSRAKRYAATTEAFIENLASRSSMSRQPYYIECAGTGRIESGIWLTRLLEDYRAAAARRPADRIE